MRGEGEQGKRGGAAGDLYVYFSVKPHKLFKRRGNDIYLEVAVSFANAALGAEITVPTLEDNIKYKIPEGTQPGTVFRIRGKGIKRLGGNDRGDMYIRWALRFRAGFRQSRRSCCALLMTASPATSRRKRKEEYSAVSNLFTVSERTALARCALFC